jgi:hypothetical protein
MLASLITCGFQNTIIEIPRKMTPEKFSIISDISKLILNV